MPVQKKKIITKQNITATVSKKILLHSSIFFFLQITNSPSTTSKDILRITLCAVHNSKKWYFLQQITFL